MEGTRRGFDLELIAAIGPHVGVPVIACGGAGTIDHVAATLRSGADAVYAGQRISAAVHRGNVWGCQFHPEKSGSAGLTIVRRFLAA